jgi:hypothetical protein
VPGLIPFLVPTDAADLCARNNMLQQTALALRQEAIALRQLVHAHVGCSCEHGEHLSSGEDLALQGLIQPLSQRKATSPVMPPAAESPPLTNSPAES